MIHSKTPEQQYATAPKVPTDRPPTKEEIWAWVEHMYGGIFGQDKMIQLAQGKWAWSYVYAVNFDGWDKHPDWTEGEVIIEAVPPRPIRPDQQGFANINKFWEIAQSKKKGAG